MANGFFNLPAFNPGRGVDFEPVNNALMNYGNVRARNQQVEQQQAQNALMQNRWETENARAQQTHQNALADRSWQQPLERQKAELGLKLTQAQIDKTNRGGDDAVQYGLQPQYARGPDGTVQAYVMGKDGRPKMIDFGNGAAALPPADLAYERARGKEGGEGAGKAQVDLPRVEANAERMRAQIKAVKESDLGRVTGWMGQLPTFRPESVDVEERAGQLTGGAFLQAFESLKGGGQITEIEGAKATAALARLQNFKQSEAGYREALKDFETEVERLVELARTRAGAPRAQAPASGPAAAAAAAAPSGGWSITRVK